MNVVIPKADQGRASVVDRLSRVLLSMPDDKAWNVAVTEKKPRRSDQQNRYLWGVVYKTVCDALGGWDADDVHEYCLGECFGWETLEGLGKRRMRPIRRSSKLNKQEFTDYVDWIQRHMAEKGIYIPDAES